MTQVNIPVNRYRENLLSGVSVGVFLILVGLLFVMIPDFFGKIIDFFRDFAVVRVPRTDVYLPAPAHPGTHSEIYAAAGQFSLVWGVFLIGLLIARFAVHSPLRKRAENTSDIVFWLGSAYLLLVMPIRTTTDWFVFWTEVIMLIGISLIVRAIFLAAAAMSRSQPTTRSV